MDSRGSTGAGTLRGKRTTSSSTASNKSRQSSTSEGPPASPKVFTSFPSLSPPPTASPKRKRSSKEASRLANSLENLHVGGQIRRPSGEDTGVLSNTSTIRKSSNTTPGESGSPQGQKSTSSFGKTLKGAANLHKSILASLTFSSPAPETRQEGVFDDPDWDAADPLEQATDEQIQRVIDRNGGAVSLLKQYSKDLAETNTRVAQERNGKVEVIERNRQLRDEFDQMKLQLEEMQRKYKNVQNLLKRFVRPDQPGQIQVVDSPNGHFILDSTTGEMIEAAKPLRKPFNPSINTASSTASSSFKEPPPKPAVPPDATSSLKQLASQKRTSKENRSSRGGSVSIRPEALSLRPESLELTAPVDAETLPPALRLDNPYSNIAPVDRLGFFFTASRETRQHEALVYQPGDTSETSSLNNYQVDDDDLDGRTMRSQDDASSSTATLSGAPDGELLCYAPSGPALRFVSGPDKGVRIFVDVSMPNTPTEGITVTNIESAQSSATVAQASASGTMVTPTRDTHSTNALETLLDKFNQVFDNQQISRMTEWTAFHSHLRANIPKTLSRASSDYSTANIARLCSKGTVSPDTLKKFNNLILSGIPVAVRREVWMERTGANALSEPGLFASLVSNASISTTTHNEITADIDRTLGNNIFFRSGAGKAKLEDILTAYAQHNPTIGYSQGLNIIAANLLLMLPSAEDAFWLLVAIIENILPFEYYHHDGNISGQSLDIDGKVLTSYVIDHLGATLHKHLRIHSVDLSMFTPGWFISAFAACLSGEPLYRIWDVLFGFCDGRYMFCFALALLKINRRGLLKCESAEELMLYLGGRMTNAAVGLDILVKEGVRMGGVVTTEDLKKRRKQFSEQ